MKRDERYVDGLLTLLDRQIVDVEGRMVAKVDDVELVEAEDGTLAMSGLLCGPAALIPRLGGRFGNALHRFWINLGRVHAGREKPQWIDLADVDSLGSEIDLSVGRDRLLVPQPDDAPGQLRRRLGDLIGMRAYDLAGKQVGCVLDVRFDRDGLEHGRRSALTALVIGKGHPGARFGYDRHPDQGPFLLSRMIHALQGRRGIVDVADVRSINWDLGKVDLSAAPRPLPPARKDH